jgi:hypothetical protein
MDKWVQGDKDFPILEYEDGGQDISEIVSLKQTVKQGLTAEYQICLMHKMLLKTYCWNDDDDDLPSNAKEQARDPATDFDLEGDAPHPSSLDPSDPDTNCFNCELLNAVQWHKHSNAYCLKCKKREKKKAKGTHRDNAAPTQEEMNENCRFGYCKPCVAFYIVSIIKTECKKKGKNAEK